MASYLNYELWTQEFDGSGRDGRLVKRLASGTVALSTSLSAAVTVPVPVGGKYPQVAGIFKVIGSDAAYLHTREQGESDPSGTGAHATSDAQPRTLIEGGKDAIRIPLSAGGKFAAVQAAALT